MSDVLKVEDGQVVSMTYTLQVEGQVVDSSDGNEPLEFLQGVGNIIPGLERELYGMAIGESKQVIVVAVDAYGEFDEDAIVEVPKAEFPADIPVEIGTELQVHGQDGETMYGHISQVGEETVQLDFNHPLAGKELQFSVTIAALRPASDEELLHGHVHGEEHDH
jgi:FKBP-type peptidyl-prolyl cis-trans isomerase SlyD